MTEDAIRLQAALLAEEMQRRGERLWAKRLRKAIRVVHEPLPCYAISHNLFWLRRDRCIGVVPPDVDQLLYAIGLLWPAPGPQRPPTRMFWPSPV